MAIDYHQVFEQAVRDSLTGLYSHGFLQDTLQRQIECARRYHWPLSLLFLDIDHFKTINDQHGHVFGDEVLRTLGATIRSVMRGADLGVRYGGEEFVVLLPHTNRAEAGIMAERIRCAVAERGCLRSQSGGRINLTISIGVASYPEDALDAAELLQHADEAMYVAKRGGRNRVASYFAKAEDRAKKRWS